MIEPYKLPEAPGVYLIRNEVTRDDYIGSSTNVRQRVKAHMSAMQSGESFQTNRRLIDLTETHGIKSFSARCLRKCDVSDIRIAEFELIGRLKPSLNVRDLPPVILRPGTTEYCRLARLANKMETNASDLASMIVNSIVRQTHGDPEALRKMLGRK